MASLEALRRGEDLLIDGASGTGRTRLLHEIARRAEEIGIPIPALAELLGDPALAELFAVKAMTPHAEDLDRAIAEAAQLLSEGDRGAAEEAADRAWALASADASADRLARAAVALPVRFGYVGARIAAFGERAMTALAAGDHEAPMRARLLARTALSGRGSDGHASSPRQTAEQAMAIAIHEDDPLTVGEALLAYAVTDLGPDTLDDRIAIARRIVSIAEDLQDSSLGTLGAFVLIGSLVESADIAAVDAELAARVRNSGEERHLAWFRAMRAILDGRVSEAEARSFEAMEIGRAERDADADSVYFGQLGIVRWLQGRETEVETFYLAAREQQPDDPVWRAVLARLWALDGRHELAAAALADLSDLQRIPRDRNWLLSLCVLAETAAIVGDEDAARALRAELLPYADRLVPIGLGIACFGSVARPLGLLARTLRFQDEAERYLRAAIDLCSRIGAQPWLACAQFDLADLLRAAGTPDPALESRAVATARAVGADHLIPEHLRHASQAGLPLTAHSGATIRVLGTFEVISANGSRAGWTSRKARDLLKILISRRGAAVNRSTLIGLLWPDIRPEEASNRLSVALSTVRRALDPGRSAAPGHYIGSDGDSIWIDVEAIPIDVLGLLAEAEQALGGGDPEALQRIVTAYRGPAFADELDAEWAEGLRGEAAAVFLSAAHRLGALALAEDGDPLLAVEVHRRILAEDPYDEGGHFGLIAALDRLGAHGRSESARKEYYERMAELGIPVTQLRGIPTPSPRLTEQGDAGQTG